jgi:hypothetical protein
VPAALVEMFRTRTRCTALAISYNTAFAILGGTAPMVAVYLVSHERGELGPAYYLMAVVAISLAGLTTIRGGQVSRCGERQASDPASTDLDKALILQDFYLFARSDRLTAQPIRRGQDRWLGCPEGSCNSLALPISAPR